jgi:hypothetical protein
VKKIFAALVYLCLLWNLALVAGVVLNASYAFERAAGGQFNTFPIGVRLLYIFISAFVLYQIVVFDRFQSGKSITSVWILKVFCGLGLLSTVLNLISRSTFERWNAVPAVIITIAFYKQIKQVDQRPS